MTIKILPPDEAAKKAKERVAEWKRQREIDAAKEMGEARKTKQENEGIRKISPKPRSKEEQKKLDIELRKVAREKKQDVQKAKELLERGADINSQYKGGEGGTALMQAVYRGHLKMIIFLLENGANVDERGPNGWTALMFAVWQWQIESAVLLIGRGADVNARDINHRTVLGQAILYNRPEFLELLKLHGATE